MKRQPGLNLVERAVIANEWRHTALEAQILALCTLDGQKLVNKAGRMLYVVLGAAIAEEVSPDLPAIRIIRGAVNAVHDQAGEPEIPDTRRASIVSGLNAAAGLIPSLPRKSLVDAACDLAPKLRRDDVVLADFESILNDCGSGKGIP